MGWDQCWPFYPDCNQHAHAENSLNELDEKAILVCSMNSGMSAAVDFFMTRVHRQVLHLLEVYIWLQDVREWRAEQGTWGLVEQESEKVIRQDIGNAIIKFTAGLLSIRILPQIRQSPEALSAVQYMLETAVQDLEDRVKGHDPRIQLESEG